MTALDPDRLSRTLKIELDEGRAASLEEAEALTRSYRLQIAVGSGLVGRPAKQMALLTAINAGVRAFPGGVAVCSSEDLVLETAWFRGERLNSVVDSFGAVNVDTLTADAPSVAIGDVADAPGTVLIYPETRGWSAGVTHMPPRPSTAVGELSLAGILAGALAVSEAFQLVRGNPQAGRREIGLSLWRPDLDWRLDEAIGPACRYLPAQWWLLGLGHLGQAYAWAIGSLPFADPARVQIYLQDPQTLVEANWSTGMLTTKTIGRERKTRLVASSLESIGFETFMVERRFDGRMHRRVDEPGLALIGFDDPRPRRDLDSAGFDHVVDIGLGQGSRYLDMTLHVLPSSRTAGEIWPSHAGSDALRLLQLPAYRAMIEQRSRAEGISKEVAGCGLTELAGRTVGAAFVGAASATLAVAEPLRLLHSGASFETISLSLNAIAQRLVQFNRAPPSPSCAYDRAVTNNVAEI